MRRVRAPGWRAVRGSVGIGSWRALLLCGLGSIAAYTMPVTQLRAHLTPIGATRIVLGPTPFAPSVEHAAEHDLRVAPLPWGTRHPTPGRCHRRPCPPLRGGPGAGRRLAADRCRPDDRPAGQQRGRKDDAPAPARHRNPAVIWHGADRRPGPRSSTGPGTRARVIPVPFHGAV